MIKELLSANQEVIISLLNVFLLRLALGEIQDLVSTNYHVKWQIMDDAHYFELIQLSHFLNFDESHLRVAS